MAAGGSTITTSSEHSSRRKRASKRVRTGRPRSGEIDAAVLGAAVELLAEHGVEGTTMSAVIERSGASRASVYLRWPNLRALLASAARHAMGRDVLLLSGDLTRDYARAAEQTQVVLAHPEFRSLLPVVLSGMLRTTDARIDFVAVIPERAAMARQYAALAAGSGFREDIRPDIAADMIMGAMLSKVLATGEAPDATDAAQILDVVLQGLRANAPLALDHPRAVRLEGGPGR
jgi:AcrR family transcriptional regulator